MSVQEAVLILEHINRQGNCSSRVAHVGKSCSYWASCGSSGTHLLLPRLPFSWSSLRRAVGWLWAETCLNYGTQELFAPLFAPSTCAEMSQACSLLNHRISEVGKDLQGRSVQPSNPTMPTEPYHEVPCLLGTLEVFEHLQGWELHYCPGQPIPMPNQLLSE